MATDLVSGTVTAGDDILASQYNNLRADLIRRAGDYEVAGGSSNAFTLVVDSSISAYAAGQVFRFQANHSITGPATLNVNGIGAVSIKKMGSADLQTGDIVSGQEVEVIYDGASFQTSSIPARPPRFNFSYPFSKNTTGTHYGASGFNHGTGEITLGQLISGNSNDFYGRLGITKNGGFYIADVANYDNISLGVDAPGGIITVQGDIIFTLNDGGVAEIHKLGVGQYTISGTAPSSADRLMLGFDPTNEYLLVWDTATTIHRYSGWDTGTLTYVDEITVDTTLTASGSWPHFCYDDVNEYYVYVDYTNDVIRRVNSSGTTVDTYDYTQDIDETYTNHPFGTCIIDGRVYMVVVAIGDDGFASGFDGFSNLSLIPTSLRV